MALTESADMLALRPGADSLMRSPPGFAWQSDGQQVVLSGLLQTDGVVRPWLNESVLNTCQHPITPRPTQGSSVSRVRCAQMLTRSVLAFGCVPLRLLLWPLTQPLTPCVLVRHGYCKQDGSHHQPGAKACTTHINRKPATTPTCRDAAIQIFPKRRLRRES